MRIWAWCAILIALRTVGGTTFTFTTLQFDLGTEAYGINNRGEIVGVIYGMNETVPFLYSGGIVQALPIPGIPTGINDACQVVGSFSIGALQHAFLYSEGVVTRIDYPGALQSEAIAINSAGVVYGEWEAANGAGEGFRYLYQNGTFTDLLLPQHRCWIYQRGGINDARVIATTLRSTMPIASWGRTQISLIAYTRSWEIRFRSQMAAVWL